MDDIEKTYDKARDYFKSSDIDNNYHLLFGKHIAGTEKDKPWKVVIKIL